MDGPSSSTDIVNMALVYMGQPVVLGIDPPAADDETALLMARLYPQSRRSMLRQYVWHFAEWQATITRSGTPLFDYTDQYDLPIDFIRFLSCTAVQEANPGFDQNQSLADYRLINNKLFLNSVADATTGVGPDSVNLRYVRDVTDVTQWSPDFADLVALDLAMKAVYAVSKSDAAVERIDALLTKALLGAVSINAAERPPVVVESSTSLFLRRFGGGGEAGVAGPVTFIP